MEGTEIQPYKGECISCGKFIDLCSNDRCIYPRERKFWVDGECCKKHCNHKLTKEEEKLFEKLFTEKTRMLFFKEDIKKSGMDTLHLRKEIIGEIIKQRYSKKVIPTKQDKIKERCILLEQENIKLKDNLRRILK